RLAVAIELDELAEEHRQLRLTVRNAACNRVQALDVTAMVGTKHVDHLVETTVELDLEIGTVGGEIGIGAIRLDQRP
ncbi:hypothetical protein, partial [Rhizobium brockwellii]|uniref:hypothetical protein n=1 Tax=Rhizobium brockwellii TaxID=3019932 RepID=UPI003F9C5155